MQVRHIMSTRVETLSPDDRIPDAELLMRILRVRHLPVVDGERRLVGLVTQRDLSRASRPETLVSEVATRNVATCAPDTPAREAGRTMLEHKYGCLPVVSDGRVIGILTESDFMRWAVDELGSAH